MDGHTICMRLFSGFSVRLERKSLQMCLSISFRQLAAYLLPLWYGIFKAVQLENGIKIQLGMIKSLLNWEKKTRQRKQKRKSYTKMKDKTDTIIDEALEPTEIQNF